MERTKDVPGISLVVPVYNVQEYLPECLDSLLGQSFAAIEIILVDDGSTDASAEICDRYAARDGRIPGRSSAECRRKQGAQRRDPSRPR